MWFFRRNSRGEENPGLNSAENDSIIEPKLKASTIEKLIEMKIDIERFSKKEIHDIEILERIVSAWYVVQALGGRDILRAISLEDYKSIGYVLFTGQHHAATSVGRGVEEIQDEEVSSLLMHQNTTKAIESLIKNGPRALKKYDDFVDKVFDHDALELDLEGSMPELNIPGILISVDTKGDILNIMGTDSISDALVFLDKAIKRGEMNQEKTDEELDKRYKNRSHIYKKFRDLSKVEGLTHKIASFESPKTIKGRAVFLQLLKENPGAYYDIEEFYKAGTINKQ